MINRIISLDYPSLIQLIKQDQSTLESKFKKIAEQMQTASSTQRAQLAAQCFQEAFNQEDMWLEKLKAKNAQMKSTAPLYYLWYLSSANASCKSKDMTVQGNPTRQFAVLFLVVIILLWFMQQPASCCEHH